MPNESKPECFLVWFDDANPYGHTPVFAVDCDDAIRKFCARQNAEPEADKDDPTVPEDLDCFPIDPIW